MSDLATAPLPATVKVAVEDLAWIPGGTFRMGSDSHYPEEAPAHDVTVSGFWMSRFVVTNAQYQRFVDETGYVTLAEKPPMPPTIQAQSPTCSCLRR